MITLITGAPGAGKTLNTLKLVQHEVGDTRPIFYAGIVDLQLPWQEKSYHELQDWRSLPDGSAIVIDEADQWAPVRGNKGTAQEFITELARHRHRGFDFYIITQKPKMLDHHLRGLVGRHLHFERAFNRNATRQLEWQRCVDDPVDYHARQEAQTSRVNFDKDYFAVYKSAEVHTHKPRVPRKAYFILGAMGVVVVCSVLLISRLSGSDPEPYAVKDPDSARSSVFDYPPDSTPIARGFSLGGDDPAMTREEYIASWEPRLPDFEHTAPAYDGVTEVKTFPRPQCIYSHRSGQCSCFTQQATPLNVSNAACRQIVSGGWFNPYRDESPQIAATGPQGGGVKGEGAAPLTPPDEDSKPRIVMLGRSTRAGPASIDVIPPSEPPQPGRAYRLPPDTPRQPTAPAFR